MSPITKYNRTNQVAMVEEDLGVYCFDIVDSPAPSKIHNSGKTSASAKKKLSTSKCWTLRFDRSKSKMGGGAGIELQSPKRKKYQASFRLEFPCTCNTAEYEALIQGIKIALAKGVENLVVIGDSQLVVRQVRNQYECKDVHLNQYRLRAFTLFLSKASKDANLASSYLHPK